jgi:hypothetical protein
MSDLRPDPPAKPHGAPLEPPTSVVTATGVPIAAEESRPQEGEEAGHREGRRRGRGARRSAEPRAVFYLHVRTVSLSISKIVPKI